MVYARILAIGGRLGKAPHFYVARQMERLALVFPRDQGGEKDLIRYILQAVFA
jgi:hypothetical protein